MGHSHHEQRWERFEKQCLAFGGENLCPPQFHSTFLSVALQPSSNQHTINDKFRALQCAGLHIYLNMLLYAIVANEQLLLKGHKYLWGVIIKDYLVSTDNISELLLVWAFDNHLLQLEMQTFRHEFSLVISTNYLCHANVRVHTKQNYVFRSKQLVDSFLSCNSVVLFI